MLYFMKHVSCSYVLGTTRIAIYYGGKVFTIWYLCPYLGLAYGPFCIICNASLFSFLFCKKVVIHWASISCPHSLIQGVVRVSPTDVGRKFS